MICCGLIEVALANQWFVRLYLFSAVICCGLIEVQRPCAPCAALRAFSAVICCGLIEVQIDDFAVVQPGQKFSAVICCGLIEVGALYMALTLFLPVFRSDMLRPH